MKARRLSLCVLTLLLAGLISAEVFDAYLVHAQAPIISAEQLRDKSRLDRARIDQEQTNALEELARENHSTARANLITSMLGFLSMLASFAFKAFADMRTHRKAALELAENTRLTQESAEESKKAIETANHVNEKIASIVARIPTPPEINQSQ